MKILHGYIRWKSPNIRSYIHLNHKLGDPLNKNFIFKQHHIFLVIGDIDMSIYSLFYKLFKFCKQYDIILVGSLMILDNNMYNLCYINKNYEIHCSQFNVKSDEYLRKIYIGLSIDKITSRINKKMINNLVRMQNTRWENINSDEKDRINSQAMQFKEMIRQFILEKRSSGKIIVDKNEMELSIVDNNIIFIINKHAYNFSIPWDF